MSAGLDKVSKGTYMKNTFDDHVSGKFQGAKFVCRYL